MVLSNAERQRAWRERQKAKIKALEEDRNRLKRKLKHLLKELKALKRQQGNPKAKRKGR